MRAAPPPPHPHPPADWARCSAENLWGDYGSAGMFIEQKNRSSVPLPEASGDASRLYSIHDISTYFTLLVGIYFPSVTGSAAAASWPAIATATPQPCLRP